MFIPESFAIGGEGGPLGCGPAILILLLVCIAIAAFVAGVWWLMKDMHQF